MTMRGSLSVVLASAALMALAAWAGGFEGPGTATVQRALAPTRALQLPMAPPPAAVPSVPAVEPDERVGSSYLHVRVWTYRDPMGNASVFAYYTAKFAALGYVTSGIGCGGDRTGTTSCDESYARGRDTAVLTVLPAVRGVSRYSLALDRIELPPRPASSLLPADVTVLQVAVRYGANGIWHRRIIRSPKGIARMRQIVNSLDVFDPGGHIGCVAVERTAILLFAAGLRPYEYTEDAGCLSVTAPGGLVLADTATLALWFAAEKDVGMAER